MINNWSIYDYIGIITTKSKVLQLIINIWSIDNQHLINWWSPVDQLIITNDQQFINCKDLFVLFLITQVHRNDNYMINSLSFKDQQLIKYWSIAYQIIKWLIVCLSFCFFSYFVCLLYCLFVCFLFFFGLYRYIGIILCRWSTVHFLRSTVDQLMINSWSTDDQ